jgi:hypothetical protein
MNTVVSIIIFTVILAISLTVMYWLSKKHEGSKIIIGLTTLFVASVLAALALFYFIIYAAIVLIIVLMVRWLMADWEHPKYGGIILGLYLGFFLSFPVGVYQYAH